MAAENQPIPDDGAAVAPETATPHLPPPAEPTQEELLADMAAVVPEAHQVSPENRAVETTREAGEYTLPLPKGTTPPKGRE